MPKKKAFIATQGPLETTIEDFWEMCFSYDVKVIAMLCQLNENNKEKCANYWEKNLNKYQIVRIGEENQIDEGLIIRKIEMKDKYNSQFKNIFQIQLTTWDDHTAPINNYEKIIKMIKFIDSENKIFPVVVHCSAGIGRTGTFISMYNLYHEILEQINNNKGAISFSIMNLVRKLKEMRLYMVENEGQYKLLYQFANKFLQEINV